ncbi:MAG: hypothetical protein NT075_20925 [Chloroflexi bacterium]|nr:hypothetical protein [Chloroflexota bacterium]
MKLPEIKPSPNGKYEAPPPSSGAFFIQQPRTEFPDDQLRPSFPTLFYNFSRHRLAGASLLRWLVGLLLISALIGLLWHWWVTGLCLSILVALFIAFHYWRRRDFVTFTADPLPPVSPRDLDVKQKIPVFVTGRFTVENKWQRYTWLPGFYRTFATRERALLCRVQNQHFLYISQWPATEIGLWYIFFMPSQVQQVQWGRLTFGGKTRLALAITYRVQQPKSRQPDNFRDENIYLTVQTEEDGHKILADLSRDVPASAFTPKPSASATRQ